MLGLTVAAVVLVGRFVYLTQRADLVSLLARALGAVSLWLGITLVAAFLQNVRSLLQKRLTGRLSVNGAAYVRFIYAVPLCLGLCAMAVGRPAEWVEYGFFHLCEHGFSCTDRGNRLPLVGFFRW